MEKELEVAKVEKGKLRENYQNNIEMSIWL